MNIKERRNRRGRQKMRMGNVDGKAIGMRMGMELGMGDGKERGWSGKGM